MQVSVKWKKQKYDVELDTSLGIDVFQAQLFQLTNVPAERQKILFRGRRIKEDEDLKRLKAKAKLMLMGSADPLPESIVNGPTQETKFLEDMTAEEKGLAKQKDPVGLNNLGNTCYMNSTLQAFRRVDEFSDELKKYAQLNPPLSGNKNNGGPGAMLVSSLGSLYQDMDKSEEPVTPQLFTSMLRMIHPQFNQTSDQGFHMQQDADECMTELLTTCSKHLKLPKELQGQAVGKQDWVHYLFGGVMTTTRTCIGLDKEPVRKESSVFLKVRCNIDNDVNFMYQGLEKSMNEIMEFKSQVTGQPAQFKSESKLDVLPRYMVVQFMRFYWLETLGDKSKILRKVSFPERFDSSLLLTDEKKQIAHKARVVMKKLDKMDFGTSSEKKGVKRRKKGSTSTSTSKKGGSDKTPMDEGDDQKKDDSAGESKIVIPKTLESTGYYDLQGVITHKGRTPSSGHYIGWAKDSGEQWVKYDDNKCSLVKQEDILALSGGLNTDMAYICIYKRCDDYKEYLEKEAAEKAKKAQSEDSDKTEKTESEDTGKEATPMTDDKDGEKTQ